MSQPFPEIDYEAYKFIDSPNLTGTPARRLLLAVLERAILDFVGNDERELEDAQGWFFDDDDDGSDEFSFAWICDELDLDVIHIREKIRKMPKRGDSRIAPWYLSKAS